MRATRLVLAFAFCSALLAVGAVAQMAPDNPRLRAPTPACALAGVRVMSHPEMHHPELKYPVPPHADTLVVWECPGLPKHPNG